MPFLQFANFLKSYSKKEMIHLKVVFQKTKIAEYTYFNPVLLKKILPNIKENKIYSVSILYREYGDYVESEIMEYYLFRDEDDIYFCKPYLENGFIFLEEISDLKMDGSPCTRKIIVEEFSKRRLYGVQIQGWNEKSGNEEDVNVFTKRYLIASDNGEIDIKKLLDKKVGYQYEYGIDDLDTESDMKMDVDNLIFQSKKTINRINICLMIKKKKSLWQRFKEWKIWK